MEGLRHLAEVNRLEAYGSTLSFRRYADDFPFFPLSDSWLDTAQGGYSEARRYVVQTSFKVIQRCLLMTTDPGDLVLDPTCGSGTTAYVAEQWGRRWITTDTSRIALNIAKTRLMTATFPFYHLYDSEEGRRLATTMNRAVGAPPPWGADPGALPQAGMKSAVGAGESDAKSGVGAADSVSAKGAAHTSLGQRPRKPTDETPSAESASHLPGHNVRYGFVYKKVPHITLGSIANHEPPAEETLYDQPLEDKKRLRVAGPFTVETLQSYEPISPEELARQREQVEELAAFEDLIFEHLKSAGVKTGDKSEQAVFTRIDRLSSTELHAEGFYETAGGEKKAYLHIGPKFGTVSKQAVNEAIKACRGRHDADWLMILGFAFESGLSDVTTTKLLANSAWRS